MNYELVEEWGVMLLYMFCAALAAWRSKAPGAKIIGHAEFWLLLSLALCLMGINKVADFQTLLIDTLKASAVYFGVESSKSTLRFAFFGGLGLSGAAVVLMAVLRYQTLLRSNSGLFMGLVCLLAYYLIRTTSIVGIAFKNNYWFNGWPLEVLSLLVIATFAFLSTDGPRRGAMGIER